MTGPPAAILASSDSPDPADWLVSQRLPFSRLVVASLVPLGFSGYARLFHPASHHGSEVRWDQVAQANGRVPHPSMEWTSITGNWSYRDGGGQAGIWTEQPAQGLLPGQQAARVARILAAHTRTPGSCWFAVWTGWGALDQSVEFLPTVALPARPMVLLTGPLAAVTPTLEAFPGHQMASLWWPEDHAWCVATDVDLMTTYVGGPIDAVNRLVADTQLEAVPVSPHQSTSWASDTVNPPPTGHP